MVAINLSDSMFQRHFHFHWQADLPETLIQGREAIYIKHFYDRLTTNPSAISKDDVEYYAQLFAQPGGIRCGLDLYRSFHQDAEDNREWLKKHGKCKVPSTTLNGENSFLVKIAGDQANEMYESVEMASVENSGHWCSEENPEDFVKKVLAFVEKHN
jgi:pimeloyl-ACP methyl ester carboxylesterase